VFVAPRSEPSSLPTAGAGAVEAATSEELREAFTTLGLEVRTVDGRLVVDGTRLTLPVVERAHPHPGVVAEIVRTTDGPGLLVADRLSESARQVLRDAGWSWLDRRGHARIWVPGLRLDAPIGLGGDRARGAGTSPWTPVGLEVALHVLIHPADAVAARAIAKDTGRSAGGTQEIVNRFVAEGLIGKASRLPVLPDLFWEAASHWPDDGWVALPEPIDAVAASLGAGALTRVDERAATLGGARINAAADLPARCYVNKASLRRLRHMVDPDRSARTWVRLSPVQWLPELDGFEPDADHPWRVAHPILCALRLGADRARGREIVEDWGVVPA